MWSLFKSKKSELTQTQEELYLKSCENMSALLKRHGLNIPPYQDKDLRRLRAHRSPVKAFEVWTTYVSIMLEAESQGENLFNGKQLLWRALKAFGYIPTEDLMEHVRDDLTIEIYTRDNWQIFRNMEFFNYVSISLDELATFHWTQDVERPKEISLYALAILAKIFIGRMNKTLKVEWPPHNLRELIGEKWLIELRMKFASPLRLKNASSKLPVAVVLANKSRVISKDGTHLI